MNIYLNVVYNTVFGEELVVNIVADGGRTTAYRMCTYDGRWWSCNLKLDVCNTPFIDYYYTVVRGETNVVRSEWTTQPHRLDLSCPKTTDLTVYDRWMNTPEEAYLYSCALSGHASLGNNSASLGNNSASLGESSAAEAAQAASPIAAAATVNPVAAASQPSANGSAITVILKVHCPGLRNGERLVLSGSDKVFGTWDITKAYPLTERQAGVWVAEIDATTLSSRQFDFKFAVVTNRAAVPATWSKTSAGYPHLWEQGHNRHIELMDMREGDMTVYELEAPVVELPPVRCAGTLVPVFSLRSKSSFGVGDFGDLRKMVAWAAQTQQKVLQVLPINDTTSSHTWTDSYPYNAISIFALHPQYADLTALPKIKDLDKQREMEALRKELNALPQIDYERVHRAKSEYLSIIYAQESERILASNDYRTFFADNEQWLVPYAQFCYLRDIYGTADYTQWSEHKVWDEKQRKKLADPKSPGYWQVAEYYFVQYILYVQMRSVHDYARSRGVMLKGDIPIGVNRYGCDVWQEPRYYNLNGQAGAPPDDFSVNGQNWGFPTYNWEEMQRDDYQWWVRRFRHMANFFDAYRIDHVLGFFRIWEIPIHSVHGLLGQFSPSLGLTRDEIQAYGLHFQEQLFTEPFITDWVLDRLFGDKASAVAAEYLDRQDNGRYRMKPAYDTQRKVEAAFEGKTTAHDLALRDKLYALISDVLFVRDRADENKFHPRIAVQHDFIYESLYDSDKHLFNNIYNDYFYRRNNNFWYREAMNKLPKIVEATRMLVCAEDLGMVPDCVAWVMNDLKILSLELQSMPKDPNTRFSDLTRNPYRSVCTISSHDTPTLRQWWDEDGERTQQYYNTMLQKYGTAPHPLPGWLARDIIARHLLCPSMLCILSIQDWLSIDEGVRLPDANAERINIPANPRHYWRYRMHINIEDLMQQHALNNNIIDLIHESDR